MARVPHDVGDGALVPRAGGAGLPGGVLLLETPQVEGAIVCVGQDVVAPGAEARTVVAQLPKEASDATELSHLR